MLFRAALGRCVPWLGVVTGSLCVPGPQRRGVDQLDTDSFIHGM